MCKNTWQFRVFKNKNDCADGTEKIPWLSEKIYLISFIYFIYLRLLEQAWKLKKIYTIFKTKPAFLMTWIWTRTGDYFYFNRPTIYKSLAATGDFSWRHPCINFMVDIIYSVMNCKERCNSIDVSHRNLYAY